STDCARDLSLICRGPCSKILTPAAGQSLRTHLQELVMAIDQAKLEAFMGRFVGDLGAVMHAATVVVGDQLGLYRSLAEGPATAEQLARRTETDPRYLKEWLSAQAASGYIEYNAESQAFSLSEEQAFALAIEGSPAFIPGAFQ